MSLLKSVKMKNKNTTGTTKKVEKKGIANKSFSELTTPKMTKKEQNEAITHHFTGIVHSVF